jgi:orotate phosphoribosyltransferase
VKTADRRTEVVLEHEYRVFFAEGGRVLIVEDILTTGETVKQLIKLVENMGGEVVGVGAIWRRSTRMKFKYPLFTVVTRDFPTYAPDECPMCKQGIPINPDFGGGPEDELEEPGE